MADDQREKAFKIVYDEAIRALDLQRAGFESLRARIGLLVSAAAVSTSFLGGLALSSGRADPGGWIAMTLFVAFGAVSLRLLWPRAEGAEGFTARPMLLIARYLERADGPAVDPWVLYRDLSLDAERQHALNQRRHHEPLARYFRAAIVLVTAEIAAWIIDLALR